MAVVTYTVPTVDQRSTRFTCEIDNVAVDVCGVAREAAFAVTGYWATGASPEMSWVQIGASVAVQARVSLTSGAITSATVYPKWKNIQHAIVEGDLVVTLPASTHVWIYVNGDQGQPIFLFSDPIIADPVEGGTVQVYDGSQTEVEEGKTLWFQPGLYDIGQDFIVNDGGTLHASGGAWIQGTLKVTDKINVTLIGHGVLDGSFSSPEFVATLGSDLEKSSYAIINGYGPTIYPQGNTLEGLTIVNPPWFCQFLGLNDIISAKAIAPWWPNCDGFTPGRWDATTDGQLVRAFAWTFDDCIHLDEYTENVVVDDCLVASAGGATFQFGFVGWPTAGTVTITDCTVVDSQSWFGANMSATNPPGEAGIILQAWTDNAVGQETSVIADVTIDGLHVEGTKGEAMLFYFGNRQYPWGADGDRVGQVKNWTISNLTVETTPIVLSKLWGNDATNTPHDLTFAGITIEGVEVTEDNWAEFVDQNSYPYNITLDQAAVVVSIAVTPAAPTVSLGGTRQFTAIATYDDASTADITDTCLWSTSDLSKLSISNSTGSEGLATALASGTVTVQALDQDSSVTGTATVTIPVVPTETGGGSAEFVPEDGTGLDDANSYCTVEFADDYHARYSGPTEWSNLSIAEKENALAEATRAADERYGLRWPGGYVLLATQALQWPRAFVYDPRGDAMEGVPLALQRWTARAALEIVNGNELFPTSGTAASGGEIQSQTVTLPGGLSKSVTYSSSQTSTPQYPALDRMLLVAGVIVGGGGWGGAEA